MQNLRDGLMNNLEIQELKSISYSTYRSKNVNFAIQHNKICFACEGYKHKGFHGYNIQLNSHNCIIYIFICDSCYCGNEKLVSPSENVFDDIANLRNITHMNKLHVHKK